MGRVYSFRDLSEQLAAQQRIEELSLTDALTGLPNRRQLAEHVAKASQRSRRDGSSFALLLIDLDRFRQINDSLGHETGDRVLIDVAQRIKSCMRADDLLARTGGDQFALLVEGADDPGRREHRAARARRGGRALQPGRRAVHADLQHRRRAVPGQRPHAPTSWCAMPKPRCWR